ncbi:hypothetical protein Acr_29g0008510 [Actinidia rufa]|uniref:Uncharacterized protein n=1 Tax=Actinidia rufa TaxID=165716 RepID=A0A7J0HF36_9ERIC|nr:hypothetical protein Acr_29g0008510 [Actinidia rufa]
MDHGEILGRISMERYLGDVGDIIGKIAIWRVSRNCWCCDGENLARADEQFDGGSGELSGDSLARFRAERDSFYLGQEGSEIKFGVLNVEMGLRRMDVWRCSVSLGASTSPQGRQWISPDINPMKSHLRIRMPNVLRTLLTEVKRIQRSAWNLAKLPSELARAITRSRLSSPWSDRHAGGVLSGLAPVVTFTHLCRSSIQLLRSSAEVRRAILTVGLLIPDFYHKQFGAVCGNDSSYYSMHLRNRYLPKPSASSPLDNRAPPMANTSQVPDLEGLHHEIHGMAEQMRVMNENNARLMQLLAVANPQPQPAPPVPGIERSRHSSRSRGRSNNPGIERARVGRRRAQSPSLHESSSSESSKTPAESEEARRGKSPRRDDRIRARNKSTSQKFRDLDARLDAINTGTSAPVTMDTLIKQTEPPFTERILRARISAKFKLPAQLADKYIAAEELAEAKRGRRGKDDHKRKEPETRRVEYREEVNKRPDRGFKRPGLRRPHTLPRRPEFTLPPLNAHPLPKCSRTLSMKNSSNGLRRLRLTPRGGIGTNTASSTETMDTIPRTAFN